MESNESVPRLACSADPGSPSSASARCFGFGQSSRWAISRSWQQQSWALLAQDNLPAFCHSLPAGWGPGSQNQGTPHGRIQKNTPCSTACGSAAEVVVGMVKSSSPLASPGTCSIPYCSSLFRCELQVRETKELVQSGTAKSFGAGTPQSLCLLFLCIQQVTSCWAPPVLPLWATHPRTCFQHATCSALHVLCFVCV